MKNLLSSLAGATTVAFIHLLLELWRSFVDFTYVLPDFSGGQVNNIALFAALYTLVYTGWLLSLRNARNGNRKGLFAALGFGVLFWLGVDISTIFFYCPGGCEEAIFNTMTYVSILVGALALFGLIFNVRKSTE